MPADRYSSVTSDDHIPRADGDWVMSFKKRCRANIILWGLPRSFSTLEIRAKLSDLSLASFVPGNVRL